MVAQVEWTVIPGEKLGPFRIGDSVNKVLHLLANCRFLNEPCKVSFNDECPYENPISIQLISPHLMLMFDPEQQSLSSILWRPNPSCTIRRHDLWLKYNFMYDNKHMWDDSDAVDCKKVLSVFPPTTLGKYSEQSLQYEIFYKQGISFEFGIKDSKTFQILRERQEHPCDSLEYCPPLRGMTISSRGNLEESIGKRNQMEVFPSEGIRLYFGDQRRVFLEIGAGIQSLLSSIGLPDSIQQGEIYNYFSLGLDFKITKRSLRTISQIIIHTNLPGSPSFGRYDRAWFQINQKHKKDRDGKGSPVDNFSKLSDIIAALGDPGPPLITEDQTLGSRHFYTFPGGTAFEITQSGFIASIHLSNSNY